MFEISFGNTSRPFKHCPYKQFKVHVNVEQHGASLFIRKDHLENYLFTKHENDKWTTLVAAILLTSTIKQNIFLIMKKKIMQKNAQKPKNAKKSA